MLKILLKKFFLITIFLIVALLMLMNLSPDIFCTSETFAKCSTQNKLTALNATYGRKIFLKEKLKLLGVPRNVSKVESKTVLIDGKFRKLPLWQHFLELQQNEQAQFNEAFDGNIWKYHFLVVVLQVRIYSYDKAKWSINELKQWLHYLFMAGVEHILICDHYSLESEKIENQLRRYIDYRLVTYVPWNSIRDPMQAQVQCYQNFIKEYEGYHLWHMAIDMDEYPFSPTDGQENFLVRYLQDVPEEVGEISLDNYLMLGQGYRSENLIIKRIVRMTNTPANDLSKPIYRPSFIGDASIHHNHLKRGLSLKAGNKLRMLHYWGSRTQNWGPDTQKTLNITIEMNTMKKFWAAKLENSLVTFGESSAISNLTGLNSL